MTLRTDGPAAEAEPDQTPTSECARFSVTFPEPSSFMTFLAPSATADSILAW